jgi:hypothetical protein
MRNEITVSPTYKKITRPTSKTFSKKEEVDQDIASKKGTVNIIYDSSR